MQIQKKRDKKKSEFHYIETQKRGGKNGRQVRQVLVYRYLGPRWASGKASAAARKSYKPCQVRNRVVRVVRYVDKGMDPCVQPSHLQRLWGTGRIVTRTKLRTPELTTTAKALEPVRTPLAPLKVQRELKAYTYKYVVVAVKCAVNYFYFLKKCNDLQVSDAATRSINTYLRMELRTTQVCTEEIQRENEQQVRKFYNSQEIYQAMLWSSAAISHKINVNHNK